MVEALKVLGVQLTEDWANSRLVVQGCGGRFPSEQLLLLRPAAAAPSCFLVLVLLLLAAAPCYSLLLLLLLELLRAAEGCQPLLLSVSPLLSTSRPVGSG